MLRRLRLFFRTSWHGCRTRQWPLPAGPFRAASGVRMGIPVFLASSIIGLFFHIHHKRSRSDPSVERLYLMGLIVHAAMLALNVSPCRLKWPFTPCGASGCRSSSPTPWHDRSDWQDTGRPGSPGSLRKGAPGRGREFPGPARKHPQAVFRFEWRAPWKATHMSPGS